MKIALFGATGKSGMLVARKALGEGHSVVAYARDPGKITFQHERLSVTRGSLTEPQAIAAAIQGTDAVISLLGPTGKSTGNELAQGMNNIVAGMKAHQVQRLIAISTPSVVAPEDRFSFSFSMAIVAIKLLQRSAYDNLIQSAAAIRGSGLDWTIVRLPMLTDRVTAPPPATGYVGSPGIKLFSLSRNVLADFLVAQLHESAWRNKLPVISNGI